jgi:hypothetical protein
LKEDVGMRIKRRISRREDEKGWRGGSGVDEVRVD